MQFGARTQQTRLNENAPLFYPGMSVKPQPTTFYSRAPDTKRSAPIITFSQSQSTEVIDGLQTMSKLM